jgi:hypothetical protein
MRLVRLHDRRGVSGGEGMAAAGTKIAPRVFTVKNPEPLHAAEHRAS